MPNQIYYNRERAVVIVIVRDENTGNKLFSATCSLKDIKRQRYISKVMKDKFGIDFNPTISPEFYKERKEDKGFFDY